MKTYGLTLETSADGWSLHDPDSDDPTPLLDGPHERDEDGTPTRPNQADYDEAASRIEIAVVRIYEGGAR